MNMENQGTVKVKFPRETDTKSGWTVDPSFIARVRHSIPPDEDEWIPSHEEVQAVLLALECIPAGIFTQPKREPLTDEDKAILEAVRRELDEGDGNAPGHGHRVAGIWDEDNGDKAGKPCAWCLTWAKFTKLIENEAAHGITSDMKQEPVAKTAKQRHEENA